MLDIKYLRQNIDFVSGKMRERGQEMNLDRFIALDAGRLDIIQEVEGLRSERNAVSTVPVRTFLRYFGHQTKW